MALHVNIASEARTFTTLSGRTVYVMEGQWSFDLVSLIAACHDKSCAPPPVGTGGSKPQGALPNRANPDIVAESLLGKGRGSWDNDMVEANWSRYPSHPVVRIRVPDEYVLALLLSEGFKSQHETGTSRGMFDPYYRSQAERRMFAVSDTRPIYGYIAHAGSSTKPGASAGGWTESYGDIVIELKPSVHERTTVTMGDSLWDGKIGSIAPLRMTDVNNASVDRKAVASTTEQRWSRYAGHYIETQVHGPITATDIKRVYIKSSDAKSMRAVLEDYPDIEIVEVRDSEHEELTVADGALVATCDLHGEFACHDKSCAPPPVGTGGSKPRGSLPNGADPDILARRLIEDGGWPVDDSYVRGNWTRYPSDPVVRVRVPNSSTLREIIDHGFKSQHETGTSRGMFDPGTREEAEQQMFSAESTRPIYGYIADAGTDTNPGASTSAYVSCYGNIVIELRPSVHERTTVTMGDSLFDAIRGDIAPLRMTDVKDASIRRKAVATSAPSKLRVTDEYVETQIHGSVTAADIKRVYIRSAYVDSVKEILRDHPDIEIVEVSDTDIYGLSVVTVGFVDGELVTTCDLHGEFACHDKSCAPPPVGTGGSKPSGKRLFDTEHLADHLMFAESRFFGDRSRERTEELWSNYPSNPAVRIRLPFDALEAIYESGGEYRSQHETGTSRGILDPQLRSQKERKMFGTESDEHPVYGYIGNAEGAAPFSNAASWSRLACYGEIGIELKPEVHTRTTVLMGDSLEGKAAPIAMDDVSGASPIRKFVAVEDHAREYDLSPTKVLYIEAQIHGGITMSDVKRIIVPSVDIYRRVERMFPDVEIVFDREISPLDPANFSICDLHGEFACHDKSCAPPPVGTGGSKPQGALPNGADPDIAAERIRNSINFSNNQERVRKNWDRYPSDPVIRIRVPSPLALKRILEDGFKSQHETGTSRGMFDPSLREQSEQNMFSAKNTRPIYGYIAHAGTETELGAGTSPWVTSYGGIAIELRQSVNERTTVTMGDSLSDAVLQRIAPLRMTDVKDASIERKGIATSRASKSDSSDEYVEAQVHGPITATDIKRIYVRPQDGEANAVKEVLKDYPDIEIVEVSNTDIYGLSTVTVGFVSGQLIASCDLHGEFACHDKSCAPPPVGTGGSKPQGALPNGADPDKVAERLLSDHNDLASDSMLRYKVSKEDVLKEWSVFPREDSVVRVRIMSSIFSDVLEQGLLTQHETGTSEGYFDPDFRDSVEAKMFGAEKTRPVYGYIGGKGVSAPNAEEIDAYGDVVIELKDSVRDRTTMTIGDSLEPDATIVPVRVNDAITLLEKGDDKSLARLGLAVTPSPVRYLEAQIHGSVTPDDFARIYVPSQPQYVIDSLKALKRELGLKFEVIIQDRDTMDEWACEAHGEFACHDKSCAPPPVGTGGSSPRGGPKAPSSSGYQSARASITEQQLMDRDWRLIANQFGGEVSETLHRIIDELENPPTSNSALYEWSGRLDEDLSRLETLMQKPDLKRGGLRVLNDMWEINGFRRPMTLVSSAEFDAAEDSAKHEMMFRGVKNSEGWRGPSLTREQVQEAMLKGEYWQGSGMYGLGTYFAKASGHDPASYPFALDDASGYGDQMIRSRLVDEASVVYYGSLLSVSSSGKMLNSLLSRVPFGDRVERDKIMHVMSKLDQIVLGSNVSVVATLLGIDALQVHHEVGLTYQIVLNRSALISDGMNVHSSKMAEHMLEFARKKVSDTETDDRSTDNDAWKKNVRSLEEMIRRFNSRLQWEQGERFSRTASSSISSATVDSERHLLSQRAGKGMTFHDWSQYTDRLTERSRFLKAVKASGSFESLPDFAKEIILSGEKVWQDAFSAR